MWYVTEQEKQAVRKGYQEMLEMEKSVLKNSLTF
jgi:hypothetical protein